MSKQKSTTTDSIKITEYTLIAEQDTVNFILEKAGYKNGKDGNVFYFRTLLVKYGRNNQYKEILAFFNGPATDIHFVRILGE